MLYTELKLGEETYKLRLGSRDIVSLEKKLGGNPMNIFMAVEKGKLPTVESVVLILQASMTKYHNGITINEVYDIYDNYIADGGTFMELIPNLIEIFKVSGFFKEEKNPN